MKSNRHGLPPAGLGAWVQVVNFAFNKDPGQLFPWATIQLGLFCYCLELWQGADWVGRLCGEPEGGVPGAGPAPRQAAASPLWFGF